MGRLTGPQTVRSLLDAGYDLLAEQGLTKLTLDAVVARTKVTKGALLHHFRSKSDLARRLLQDSIADFDALVAQFLEADHSPGAYTRAYLKAVATPLQDSAKRRVFQAIAELSRDPELKAVFQQATRRWSRAIQEDGLDPVRAELIRLAADGLWLHETANTRTLDSRLCAQVTKLLLRMAEGK